MVQYWGGLRTYPESSWSLDTGADNAEKSPGIEPSKKQPLSPGRGRGENGRFV